MVDVSVTVRAECSPAHAYRYVADARNLAVWLSTTVGVRDHPNGVLSDGDTLTTLEGHRAMSRPVKWAVSADEDRVFCLQTIDEPTGSWTYSFVFDLDSAGTLITASVKGLPKGPFRLLGPIAGWGFRRQLNSDLRRLQSALLGGA